MRDDPAWLSKVLNALRSGPVSVSQASTRDGVMSSKSSASSRRSRSRLSTNTATRLSFAIVGGDHVEEGHLLVAREVGAQAGGADRVGLALHLEVEHAAARVLEHPLVRDSRWTGAACPRVGHQRRDHVDDLREAGHAHAVRLAHQRVEEAAGEQRVLEVVDLLEQLRRELPLPSRCAGRARDTRRSIRRTTATAASASGAGPARSRRPR